MDTCLAAPQASPARSRAAAVAAASLPRRGAAVSALPDREQRFTLTDAIAGILATCSIALSGIALADRPARLAPIAVLVALLAGRMSVRFQRLAFWAAVAAMVGWTLGMTLAVVTNHPIL